MGNQTSSQGNEAVNKKQNNIMMNSDKKPSHDSFFLKDNSSYKGILTIKSMSSQSSTATANKNSKETIEDEKTSTTNDKHVEMKVPTHFEWKEGGTTVYLTGSFCNWNEKFLMSKINNNFELTIELQKGSYQYKFIVDHSWKFSKHHPTCNDGRGNINNIIDTNLYLPPKSEEKKEKVREKKERKLSKNDSDYSTDIPAKKELYVDASACPNNYKLLFDIERFSHQKYSEKDEFIEISNVFHCNENSSYIPINTPPHVNTNHIFTNKIWSKKSVISSGMSERVRNKYITFIYYKPVN
jgi:hypothetical protein